MRSNHKRQSPWVSGSFYLTAFVVVIAALLTAARLLPVIAVPIVLLGGILALSIIGAFQLRQDDKLSQKNFLELMVLTFKYLQGVRSFFRTISEVDPYMGVCGTLIDISKNIEPSAIANLT